MSVAIRAERAGDEAAIHRLTQAAFNGHPHSDGTEPAMVAALRQRGELSLSLVAEDGARIVGHAAFSPVTLSDGEEGWLALGPISVDPARQGEGIGRALVEAGAAQLRDGGAKGVVLDGDPELYRRFGFRRDTPLFIEGPLAPYFQALPFTDRPPAASVTFAPAFDTSEG